MKLKSVSNNQRVSQCCNLARLCSPMGVQHFSSCCPIRRVLSFYQAHMNHDICNTLKSLSRPFQNAHKNYIILYVLSIRPMNRACISQFFLPFIPSVPAPDHGTSLLILPVLSVFRQVCEEKIIAASICLWAEKKVWHIMWSGRKIRLRGKKKKTEGDFKRSKNAFPPFLPL